MISTRMQHPHYFIKEKTRAMSYQFRMKIVERLQESLVPNELSIVIPLQPMSVVYGLGDSSTQDMVQSVLPILGLENYVPD